MPREDSPRPEPAQLRRLRRLLRDLWPILSGCVTVSRRPCVNRKRCKRCRSGERHPAVYFMFRHGKVARNVYLPKELIPEVERGIRHWRELQEAVAKASLSYVEGLKERAKGA